jgi:hypothetical protein
VQVVGDELEFKAMRVSKEENAEKFMMNVIKKTFKYTFRFSRECLRLISRVGQTGRFGDSSMAQGDGHISRIINRRNTNGQ